MKPTIVILLIANAASLGWNLSFIRAAGPTPSISFIGAGIAVVAIVALLYTWRRLA